MRRDWSSDSQCDLSQQLAAKMAKPIPATKTVSNRSREWRVIRYNRCCELKQLVDTYGVRSP